MGGLIRMRVAEARSAAAETRAATALPVSLLQTAMRSSAETGSKRVPHSVAPTGFAQKPAVPVLETRIAVTHRPCGQSPHAGQRLNGHASADVDACAAADVRAGIARHRMPADLRNVRMRAAAAVADGSRHRHIAAEDDAAAGSAAGSAGPSGDGGPFRSRKPPFDLPPGGSCHAPHPRCA